MGVGGGAKGGTEDAETEVVNGGPLGATGRDDPQKPPLRGPRRETPQDVLVGGLVSWSSSVDPKGLSTRNRLRRSTEGRYTGRVGP